MRVYLTVTELDQREWDGQGWWTSTQWFMQRCRSGRKMRSHVALLFENRPGSLQIAPGGSLRSARGAETVTWDFTSRPFVGFAPIGDPSSWYKQFSSSVIEAYEFVAEDQEALARRMHDVATEITIDPPGYDDSLKWAAWMFPWAAPSKDTMGQRKTNCVGATLYVVEQARGPIGLTWGYEAHLPGQLPELLQERGVIGGMVRRFRPVQEQLPLTMIHH